VRLLDKLKLSDRFAAIRGQDTFGIQKPDPEILRRTIAAAARCKQAIMIGDSLTDIRTARAAGIPIIAVDFGYSERPIVQFEPNGTISHFAQLPASIATISPAI
jgi:phosphoglycolate phosphatase